MEKTITIIVPIISKPECRARVRAELVQLASKSRQEKGNVFYVPHETVDTPDKFIIYERWKNQAALDHHMDQEYLKKFLADSAAWLSEPIKGAFCHELT